MEHPEVVAVEVVTEVVAEVVSIIWSFNVRAFKTQYVQMLKLNLDHNWYCSNSCALVFYYAFMVAIYFCTCLFILQGWKVGKKQLSNLIDMKVSNLLFHIKVGGITGNIKFLFREVVKKQFCIILYLMKAWIILPVSYNFFICFDFRRFYSKR